MNSIKFNGKPSKKDMDIVNKLTTKKVVKAVENLIDSNQKLADKYGYTISIGTKDREVVIAEPRKNK
jgi:hypothetical protein